MAIHLSKMDCFATLAMTEAIYSNSSANLRALRFFQWPR